MSSLNLAQMPLDESKIKPSSSYFKLQSIERVLVCFDTLPIMITKNENEDYVCSWTDFGGFGVFIDKLVDDKTGSELKQLIYVGQLSTHIPPDQQDHVRNLLKVLTPQCVPVFTQPEEREAHYQTFCKKILWPLFHNCIDTSNIDVTPEKRQEAWSSYSYVNMEFARTIVENFNLGDTIWIQDYHLLLLPSYLARKIPPGQATIGLFLHTPFPSTEILRTLPWREEILRGMLNVDHLGFHLYEYARHFLTCAMKVLGLDKEIRKNGQLGLEYDGKKVMITCTMLATDVPRIVSAVNNEVQMKQSNINICGLIGLPENHLRENIIISSVDPLERLKGIPLKLLAIENLLKNQPTMLGKFHMIQIGLTFDVSADSKDSLSSEITSIVDRINSHFQRTDLKPIVIYKEVPMLDYFDRLALWRFTRIFLNTSIRDGLNMMPSEYIIARSSLGLGTTSEKSFVESDSNRKKHSTTGEVVLSPNSSSMSGVAIVSEFSGTSRALSGSLKINPWRLALCTEVIEKAMRMHINEQSARLEQDTYYLNQNIAKLWVNRVLADVKDAGRERVTEISSTFMGIGLGLGVRKVAFHSGFKKLEYGGELSIAFKTAKKRLILLDSRGTLFPSSKFSLVNKLFRPNLSSARLYTGPSPRNSPPDGTGTLRKKMQAPKQTILPENLVAGLYSLQNNANTVIFILAGSVRTEVFQQFGEFDKINFVAEHGFYLNWANKRSQVGGHDPNGNMGWELLGGNRVRTGTSCSTIQVSNSTGNGIWMRLLRSSGGFHGIDLPKETTSFTIETHSDVCAVAYQFWNKGENESWNPKGVLPIESGHCLKFENNTCVSSAPFISAGHDTARKKLNQNLIEYVSDDWISLTKSIMLDFQDRTTGSFTEQRDSSLLWRFRDTDPDFGDLQSKELQNQLNGTLKNYPVDVLSGKDYVEVRPEGVNKGAVVQFILSIVKDVDFILSIGDDSADETMFSVLESEKDIHKANVFTATVGKKPSSAGYYLDDYKEVNELISCLAAADRMASSTSEDFKNKSKRPESPRGELRKTMDSPMKDIKKKKSSNSMSNMDVDSTISTKSNESSSPPSPIPPLQQEGNVVKKLVKPSPKNITIKDVPKSVKNSLPLPPIERIKTINNSNTSSNTAIARPSTMFSSLSQYFSSSKLLIISIIGAIFVFLIRKKQS